MVSPEIRIQQAEEEAKQLFNFPNFYQRFMVKEVRFDGFSYMIIKPRFDSENRYLPKLKEIFEKHGFNVENLDDGSIKIT